MNAEPLGDTSTATPGTNNGTSAGTVRYSVPEVARLLGISERAVRKRIVAGTLNAERDGGQWAVYLPAEPGPEPIGPAGTGAVPGGTNSTELGGTEAVPSADVAELVLLVATQQAKLNRLHEERAELFGRLGFYQARVQALEEQVKALAAPRFYGSGENGNGPDSASQRVSEGANGPNPANPRAEGPQSASGGQPGDAAATSENESTGHENGQDRTAQKAAWWQFWRWGVGLVV